MGNWNPEVIGVTGKIRIEGLVPMKSGIKKHFFPPRNDGNGGNEGTCQSMEMKNPSWRFAIHQ